MRAGTKFQHIPYKGAGPALSDVVAGHVAVMFNALPASVPYIRSGQLKAFAVGTPKRSPLMPELPTVAELGYPGFNASTFVSIMAPGKTPPDIVNKLASEIQRALATPAMAEWVRSQGMDSVGSTPQQFAADLAAEASQWQQVIKQTGIQAE